MTFEQAFWDEMAKIAVVKEQRGLGYGIKRTFGPDVEKAKGMVKSVVGAGKSLWKRLTEGGPQSQEMFARVRKAAKEGR